MVKHCLIGRVYEDYANKRKQIPKQRVCKVCGAKFALITKKTKSGTKGSWVEVPLLVGAKKGNPAPADYEYTCGCSDIKDDSSAQNQSYSCSQCKNNRTANPFSFNPYFMRINMVTGDGCKSQGSHRTLDPLVTKAEPCCEAGCVIFNELIEAYKNRIERRGTLINPCEYCIRYWNNDHPNGPCIGKFNGEQTPVTVY